MQNIGGKQYYSIDEAASLAGVSVRTLRRWISAGRLSDFLFPFRVGTCILYRLEMPEEDEPKNEKGEWILVKPSEAKGGVPNESNSSS